MGESWSSGWCMKMSQLQRCQRWSVGITSQYERYGMIEEVRQWEVGLGEIL